MNIRTLAAGLMLYSGISHPAQLVIYGATDPQLFTPAIVGSSFFFIGLFLLTEKRLALWVGAVIPLLMGIGAFYRILTQEPILCTYIHTLIDFIVSPLCFYLLTCDQDHRAATR